MLRIEASSKQVCCQMFYCCELSVRLTAGHFPLSLFSFTSNYAQLSLMNCQSSDCNKIIELKSNRRKVGNTKTHSSKAHGFDKFQRLKVSCKRKLQDRRYYFQNVCRKTALKNSLCFSTIGTQTSKVPNPEDRPTINSYKMQFKTLTNKYDGLSKLKK